MNVKHIFNEIEKNLYHLSMSVGLAICQVDVTTSLEQMMIQADQQMYANKRIKRT